ncbi:type 1 fimbrial protein [Escherichia coli]|nr:type 1 fimbrial protein [Escherichia coli]
MKRLHKRFLLATFCALFTATLQAADVTITVNGRVVAKPCTIQTKEANVNLGDLYTRNLQQPGSASGWHNITLSLTDCPVETSAVTAIVTGSTDNTGYYKNEGTAENIQIELRDDQDAALKNGSSRQVFANTAPDATKASGVGVTLMRNGKILATGENVSLGTVNKSKVPLGLSATYGQTGNKVSAGTVQSVIGVTFIYE